VIAIVAAAGILPGVTEFGDTVQVVSAGDPLQANLTGVANGPPNGEIVSEYVAVDPDLTVVLAEDVVRLKSSPVPVKFVVWVVPCALSLTVRVPLRFPEAFGVKAIFMVQLEPAATVTGQLLDCE
jgi:hypothetical protein